MMLEIMLCTFIFTTIPSIYIIINLYRKCDKLEQWTDATYQMIKGTLVDFRKIDSTGHFEADDEIDSSLMCRLLSQADENEYKFARKDFVCPDVEQVSNFTSPYLQKNSTSCGDDG